VDLRNPCASQKIRRIYRILALFKNQADFLGGFMKSLCFYKNQADDRILVCLVRKPAGLEKTGGPLTV
jgi:hypothetical protein